MRVRMRLDGVRRTRNMVLLPTHSICMDGSIWATSIALVGVAVSGCMSEPMGRFLTTASEATGIPTTTNQMTRWIRFR